MAPPNPVRRGHPYADLNAEEVLRLRGSGRSWRAIGRKLNTATSTVREVHARAVTAAQTSAIEPIPCEKSAK